MQDEFLTKCVVDPSTRKFYIYSNEGDSKVVDCETMEQFMSVLSFIRDTCDEDIVSYANPLWLNIIYLSTKKS